ncbi:MAG: tRNA pseudouridine(38-40) synthase TruA [Clostridia bacterium]|nr:tRNA pseudouridine(38-40) synthase TruA [Clostridia bacterium]
MNNYKLTIQYDGGRYKGWQRLGAGENTIQGKLEKVITEMIGEQTEIIGCSRTDTGVHALSQIASFKCRRHFSVEEIKTYLNHYLPNDICVTEVKEVDELFHARFHAKSKTYLYKIWNHEEGNPFMRKYSMHIKEKLDLEAIKEAAPVFLGEHDFTSFSNARSKKKSFIREIYEVDIKEEHGCIVIRIRGNGFLYNMVRKMVGALIEVGLSKTEQTSIQKILASKERNMVGVIADANGLYLEKVEY